MRRLYGPSVGITDEPDMSGWEPTPVDDLPAHMRPTVELVNRFMQALYDGRVGPRHLWQSAGPDYDQERVVISIYPDDDFFRDAVARVMPPDSYIIEIDRVVMLGSTADN